MHIMPMELHYYNQMIGTSILGNYLPFQQNYHLQIKDGLATP